MLRNNRIAILASGNGSNAQALMDHFAGGKTGEVALIITDNPRARVIERATEAKIPCLAIHRRDLAAQETLAIMGALGVDLVVLAGYLSLVPTEFITAFHGKIINLHPALLPKYGGKGMYGERVHRAVIENGERVSGITIHWVTPEYDRGTIIFQAQCPVCPDDTIETLAARIHGLEHAHLPRITEQIIREGLVPEALQPTQKRI